MAIRHDAALIHDAVVSVGVASEIDWNEFVRAYEPALRRVIGRRVSPSQVDDVLQETFIRAYKGIPRLDLSIPVWPWLVTLAVRASVDHWRGRGDVPVADVERRLAESSEGGLDTVELRTLIDSVLATLPSRHHRLLHRCIVEDVAPSQVADEESVSSDTVRAALSRARRSFRARYVLVDTETAAITAMAFARLRSTVRRVLASAGIGAPQLVAGLAAGLLAAAALVAAPDPSSADSPETKLAAVDSRAAVPAVEAPGAPFQREQSQHSGSDMGAGGGGDWSAPGLPPSVGSVRVRSVDLSVDRNPEEPYVRVAVAFTDPAGDGHSDVSVEVKCKRSDVARRACEVLREVPATESGD